MWCTNPPHERSDHEPSTSEQVLPLYLLLPDVQTLAFTHPATRWPPTHRSRYFCEDIRGGLCTLKGIAEIASVR